MHTVSLFTNFPIFFIVIASSSACGRVFIKAPLPQVTSNTILLAPDAIFLLMILEAINVILSVVEILSLNAYNFLSAGAKFSVCPISEILISFTLFLNFSIDKLV